MPRRLKRSEKFQENVNKTRFELFYHDHLVDIGKEVATRMSQYKSEQIPTRYENARDYMLRTKVYFYDIAQPRVSPLRRESSRTILNGEIRHKGSVLDE